jgi:hypothetical protein
VTITSEMNACAAVREAGGEPNLAFRQIQLVVGRSSCGEGAGFH